MRETDTDAFLAEGHAMTCCGQSMQAVDSGILECRTCDCYVSTSHGRIEKTSHCRKHGGR